MGIFGRYAPKYTHKNSFDKPLVMNIEVNYKFRGGLRMISRIWHGWTTHQNADVYEQLLKEEIFLGIQNRQIAGFKGIQLLRRQLKEETEFITIMTFDSLESVKEFAGSDYEQAVVPEKARLVLSHFDPRSQHYEIKAERKGTD
jgi:heme-degrading monooxygenase HmoA